jgi:adenylylsulfate kinase-like enzyme
VAQQLAPEEPEAGPWRAKRLAVVIESLSRLGTAARTGDRSMVLAVDGRSSSGKTTLAARVQAAVAGSAIVHTDDLA